MRKLFSILIATVVFLGIVPSYIGAAATVTEPQVQVKLVKYLGNQSSISLKIVGSYYLNGDSTNLLTSDRSYTVKVENETLVLYDGTTEIPTENKLSITPVNSIDHAVINNREYAGSFLFTVDKNQYVRPINTINLEDYVKGVVPDEMPPLWQMEALKAQAVAARTYAYYKINQVIDDTTSNQVYGGVTRLHPRSSEAVDATEGEILTSDGNVILAAFSASNGGKTEKHFNVWYPESLPYFKVQIDEYDTTNTWEATLHKQQIDVSSLDLKNLDSWWDSTNEVDAKYASNIKKWMMNDQPELRGKQIKIVAIPKVSFYSPTESGRFTKSNLTVEFFVKDDFNSNGELELRTASINNQLADDMRTIIGTNDPDPKKAGTRDMKSNLFSINETNDAFVFSGSGNGHGVGLSQYGANRRAAAGIQYRDILSFYYPSTALTKQYAIPPEPVKVNGVTDKDTVVTGEAEAGSTVEVKANGSLIGSGTAVTDGKFSITIPIQKAGTELVFTATDKAGNVGEGTTVVVRDVTAPENPEVNEVTDKDNSVTGEAEAGSTVEVKVNGAVIGTGTAAEDGRYEVTIPVQQAGIELAIFSTDKVGNVSEETTVVVKDTSAPGKPVVNQVSDKDTIVTGQAEAGSTIDVKVNGSVIGTGIAGQDGKYKVAIRVQKAGTVVEIVSTDAAGNQSEGTTIKVIDKTAPTVLTVNTVSDKSKEVTGKTEAGSTVSIKIGTKVYAAKAYSNGNFKVTIPAQKAGAKLFVTAKDAAGNVSVAKSITVLDKTAPAVPTVSTITDLAKVVTGKAEAGAIVTVTIGTKRYIGKVDTKGNFKLTILVQKAGTKVIVTAKDAAGNVSAAKSVIVIDKTAPSAPKIKTTVKSTTKEITGTAEAYSTITVKVGKKVIGTAKTDSKGKYKVKIKAQKKKTVLSVTATDKAKNVSKAVTVKVK